MKCRSLLMQVICICLFYAQANARQINPGIKEPIIIEMTLPEGFKKELIHLETIPADYAVRPKPEVRIPAWNGNSVKWIIPGDRPLLGNLSSIFGPAHILHLYEPGDSIHIDIRTAKTIYTGKGAEKLKLLKEVKERSIAIRAVYISGFDPAKFSSDYYQIGALKDFTDWDKSLNKEVEMLDSVFNTYQGKLSLYAFNRLKAEGIVDIESDRLTKFGTLINKATELNLPDGELGRMFDTITTSTHAQWLHGLKIKVSSSSYFYDFVRKSVQRKYDFNYEHDSLSTSGRIMMYNDLGKKIYNGPILQDFLVYLLTDAGLKEHVRKDGSTPEIEKLLIDFYRMPDYPDHKAFVKEYEQMIREWVISKGTNAADFSLEDVNGKLYSKRDFKDKVVILSFLDNSQQSIEMKNALKNVQKKFDENPDVVFLNVSTEKNKAIWKKNIAAPYDQGKNVINLYTNGQGKNHPILKHYNVKAYPAFDVSDLPKIFLLDNRGKFLYFGALYKPSFASPLKRTAIDKILPDPRKDNGHALINDIYSQLTLMKDGPYIFYEKDGVTAYKVHSSKVYKQKLAAKKSNQLAAQTDDLRKAFPVELKSKLTLESSVTAVRPERLFVLSDIEGEFEAFRKLLQANKIIDDQFNWTFGKGHLVFAGDMFDRGLQVTECMWLVYMLEEKAIAAGGHVHFVLGNHEIMNLQGDHRYVKEKYKENAKLMGKTIIQLYNENSELGRWLRTKNIIEKIGDLLFMHGGFSQELNNQPLSVEQLNATARPFYANSKAADNTDPKVGLLYNSMTSPFWYRLYYRESENRRIYKAKESQVDSTLQKFNVKHIITGHTIIADSITTHYNNKVINTDTRHREGKSEALLIEGSNFYRVNAEGKKVLLFKEE